MATPPDIDSGKYFCEVRLESCRNAIWLRAVASVKTGRMGADLPLSQCATNEPEMARRSERRSKLPPLSKIIPDAGCPAHQVNGGDIGGEHSNPITGQVNVLPAKK